jgi:uncharacterized protein
MPAFTSILENRILLVALAACLMAQGAKVIVELAQYRRLNFKVMTAEFALRASDRLGFWRRRGNGLE